VVADATAHPATGAQRRIVTQALSESIFEILAGGHQVEERAQRSGCGELISQRRGQGNGKILEHGAHGVVDAFGIGRTAGHVTAANTAAPDSLQVASLELGGQVA